MNKAEIGHFLDNFKNNKNLFVDSMVDTFKKSNILLAVQNGMDEKDASEYVESMSSSIEICMNDVFDNVYKILPTIIK